MKAVTVKGEAAKYIIIKGTFRHVRQSARGTTEGRLSHRPVRQREKISTESDWQEGEGEKEGREEEGKGRYERRNPH